MQNRNIQIEDLRSVINEQQLKIEEQNEISKVNHHLNDEINSLRKQMLLNDLNMIKAKKDNSKKDKDNIDTARTNET